MAIDFNAGKGDDEALMAQINTTPLVDVMLVLLIIFLITIPVVNSSVAVTLPREAVQVSEPKGENVIISVDAAGGVYWFDTRLDGPAALAGLLAQVSVLQPQPEVHIRGDARGSYEGVGRVVYATQKAGIVKVGFITEPPARP
jgi:biopolymer transport protein ExbD